MNRDDICKNTDNKRLIVRLRNLVKNTFDVFWPNNIPKLMVNSHSKEI